MDNRSAGVLETVRAGASVGTAGWAAREEQPQTGVREREGGRAMKVRAGFQDPRQPRLTWPQGARPEADPGL